MSRCEAEMCRNWTGHGCICEVMDIERDVVPDPYDYSLSAGELDGEWEW